MSANNSLRNQSGITVVELVIGAALLAIVIFIASGFITRVQKSAKHDSSRQTSQKLVQGLFSLIRRDAAVQISGGLTVPSAGSLHITRVAKGSDDESKTYQVLFQSQCKPYPAASANLFDQVYSPSNRSRIYAAPYNCLRSLNCPAKQYPVVSLSLSGVNTASYPQLEFPGLSLCATTMSDQIQVILESVYAPGDREPLEAAVLQKVYMIPIKDAGDLTILPN